jgi:hypothetical protein
MHQKQIRSSYNMYKNLKAAILTCLAILICAKHA